MMANKITLALLMLLGASANAFELYTHAAISAQAYIKPSLDPYTNGQFIENLGID